MDESGPAGGPLSRRSACWAALYQRDPRHRRGVIDASRIKAFPIQEPQSLRRTPRQRDASTMWRSPACFFDFPNGSSRVSTSEAYQPNGAVSDARAGRRTHIARPVSRFSYFCGCGAGFGCCCGETYW
jgi:hypothetical protein